MDLRWHFKPAGTKMQSTKKVGHFTHSKQQHHLGMLVFPIFTPFQGVWKEEIRWAHQIFISVQDEVQGMDLRWHFKPTGTNTRERSYFFWFLLRFKKHTERRSAELVKHFFMTSASCISSASQQAQNSKHKKRGTFYTEMIINTRERSEFFITFAPFQNKSYKKMSKRSKIEKMEEL